MTTDANSMPPDFSHEADAFALEESVSAVRRLLASQGSRIDECRVGMILGSGLKIVGDALLEGGGAAIDYEALPVLPQPTVIGHAGRLVVGGRKSCSIVAMQGRIHHYEGFCHQRLTASVRLLYALGVRTLLLTNAAGAVSGHMAPGDVMIITGHLNLCDDRILSAMQGSNADDMTRTVWCAKVAAHLQQGFENYSRNVHSGTYAMMSGPNYETPAEIRMLSRLGADAVGMSTVPEALAAAELGMRVGGISCITNLAAGISAQPLDHADVFAMAASVGPELAEGLLKTANGLS